MRMGLMLGCLVLDASEDHDSGGIMSGLGLATQVLNERPSERLSEG